MNRFLIASLEKGLLVISIWLEKRPNVQSTLDVSSIVKALIEKTLISPKQPIRASSTGVILLLFERGCKAAIQEAVFVNLGQKNPKIVCSSIQLVVELLTQFGAKKLDMLKPYLPEMEKLSQSQQSVVRNEVMTFYKEVRRSSNG